MNVVLQLLHGMNCTRDLLCGSEPSSILPETNSPSIAERLSHLFKMMHAAGDPLSIEEFKKALVATPLFEEFNNDCQHDAHHFLLKILKTLANDSSTLIQQTVTSCFCSSLISQLCCLTCLSSSSNISDHSISIELSITGNTLEDCLSNFFDPERLDDGWLCANCKAHRSVEKSFFLQKRPIMIVNLKRFNNESKKITRMVRYPVENLSFPNIVTDDTLKVNKNVRYNLFAVINHIGGNCTSGHYTLFMKKDDKWWKFDDENVVQIRNSQVLSPNAYTLVYIKNDRVKELGA